MKGRQNPFDASPAAAVEYDTWYDSSVGRSVLEVEARCIRELVEGAPRPWLEIGAGSGRFGGDLNAEVGLDPAPNLLRIAATRMPSVVRGVAEALPFRDASFGASLVVTALEFVTDARRALHEASRVLRRDGRLVIGFIPAGGSWGAAYREQGRDAASVFHGAHFFVAGELVSHAGGVGLQVVGARSTLFASPGEAQAASVDERALHEAGFVPLAFERLDRTGGDKHA